jgi:DNA-binding transcriptional LysR family regulator
VGQLSEPPAPGGFRRETLYDEPIAVLARAEHPVFDGDASEIVVLARYELGLRR